MNLVRKIRIARTSRTVPLEITAASFEDVVAWQQLIQKPFVYPAGGIGHNWDWPALFIQCQVVETMMGRDTGVYQLSVENDKGEAVPVAQIIVTLPYAWPGPKKSQGCAFLWFMMSTPHEALKEYGVSERFSVMNVVLDTLIQISLEHGYGGRIGLHAAAGSTVEETETLVKKYESYGLRKRQKRWWSFFRFPHRRDDGRFFYFNDEDALAFAEKQDDLR